MARQETAAAAADPTPTPIQCLRGRERMNALHAAASPDKGVAASFGAVTHPKAPAAPTTHGMLSIPEIRALSSCFAGTGKASLAMLKHTSKHLRDEEDVS